MIKHSRPHLLYLALIAAIGLFYWQRLKSDNQRIALLNRTTDEAIASVDHSNGELQKSMREFVREYPDRKYDELMLLASKADSLLLNCFTYAASGDSLSPQLWMLTNRDERVLKVFQVLLPSKKQVDPSSEYETVVLQNDSLRKYWALATTLNYFAEQMTRPCFYVDVWAPAVSNNVICPTRGRSFEAEIVLASIKGPQLLRLSANGQNLVLKDDIARFVHTFPGPGVYPLHIKAEFSHFYSDSLRVAEKTFYLHVNN